MVRIRGVLIKMMLKDKQRIKRKPWVPPPAKSAKDGKGVLNDDGERCKDKNRNCAGSDKVELSRTYVTGSSAISVPIAKSIPHDVNPNVSSKPFSENLKLIERETTRSQPSMVSNSMDNVKLHKDLSHKFHELGRCYKFMKSHDNSVQNSLKYLRRITSASEDKKANLAYFIPQIENKIVLYSDKLRELDNHLAAFEICQKENLSESEEYLVAAEVSKYDLICQLLESYELVTTAFQFISDHHHQQEINALLSQHESLQKELQEMQNKYTTKVQSLEKEIFLAQEDVRNLKIINSSLESDVSTAEVEVMQKKSVINELEFRIQTVEHKGIIEREKFFEATEGMKTQQEAEKTALKKAVRMHKIRADEFEKTISELKTSIKEKEKELYEIAAERDRWKADVTNIKNKLVESGCYIQGLEIKISDMSNHQKRLESAHRNELDLERSLKEKSSLLDDATKENQTLKKNIVTLENKLKLAAQEAEKHQMKSETAKAVETENAQVLSEKSDVLNLLLEALKISKEQAGNGKNEKQSIDHEPVLDLVKVTQEIKTLLEKITQLNHNQDTKDKDVHMKEEQLHELREKYNKEVYEKQKLQDTINSMKALNFEHQVKQSSFSGGTQLLNSAENLRLQSLEDELRRKNLDLLSLNEKNRLVENKLLMQIKELEENLSRVSMNYESLQKYVTVLKSSYSNVFGGP